MNIVEKMMLAGLGLVLANSAKETYLMQRTIERPAHDLYSDLATSRHLPGRTRTVYGKSGAITQVLVSGDGRESVSWQIMHSGEVVSRFSAKLVPVDGARSRIEWDEEEVDDAKAKALADEPETATAVDLLEDVIKEQLSATREGRPFDEAAMDEKARGVGLTFPDPGKLAQKEEAKAREAARHPQAKPPEGQNAQDIAALAPDAQGKTGQPQAPQHWVVLAPLKPGRSGACRGV
ncbi:MAG TPA: hypothetical protein PKA59_06370 [Chakrabartia sp.]|nr:hypothetical protein [Chakrabartia sp.]